MTSDTGSKDKLDNTDESRVRNDICPSKSTVYLGNINYSLTNNDLVKLVEHCGRVVCAKIVKDRVTRKSRGYAFVQFLQVEGAEKCVQEYNGTEVFGRRWSCSIAKDNGRAAEFIRKRTYPDKTRCYECGVYGHLSYNCSKNALGDREPPKKRKKRKKTHKFANDEIGTNKCSQTDNESSSLDEDSESGNEIDSLSAAINFQRTISEEEDYRNRVASGNYETPDTSNPKGGEPSKRKFVKDEYFSDEENFVDD